MKKILLALVAVFLSIAAFAQTSSTTNIPFEFRVGDTLMPAGTYKISSQFQSGDFVMVSNYDARKNAGVLTTRMGPTQKREQPRLVFHRYGSVYFLAEVWSPNTEYGRKLKAGPAERETAKIQLMELATVRFE
jgi:hypothetical protein